MLAFLFPISFLAGVADACGLTRLVGHHVAFVTGDLIAATAAVSRGGLPALALLLAVGSFVGGAVLGGILALLTRQHAGSIILASAAFLLLAALAPSLSIYALAAALGVLNAAISRAGRISVGLTFMTGNLVRFGQGLGRALCGRPDRWLWACELLPVLGLISGALTAMLLQARWGDGVVWFLPAFALVLAACCAIWPPHRRT